MGSRARRGWVSAAAAILAGLAVGTLPARAALIVDIQPVSICLDDGSSCAGIGFNAAALQNFWLNEAGITLNILTARTFNSTTFQTMDTITEANNLVLTNPSPDPAGPTNFTSGPITVWFADSAFSPPGQVESSMVNGNRTWLAANLGAVDQTLFLAHALGHNFGLLHIAGFDPTNLMSPTFAAGTGLSTLFLDSSQAAVVQSSRFVREGEIAVVPAPAALGLFAFGLAALARRRMA